MSNVINNSNEPIPVSVQRSVRSTTVLANAGEVAVSIISEIAGNDISTALNGNQVTNTVLQNILYNRIIKRVNEASQGS